MDAGALGADVGGGVSIESEALLSGGLLIVGAVLLGGALLVLGEVLPGGELLLLGALLLDGEPLPVGTLVLGGGLLVLGALLVAGLLVVCGAVVAGWLGRTEVVPRAVERAIVLEAGWADAPSPGPLWLPLLPGRRDAVLATGANKPADLALRPLSCLLPAGTDGGATLLAR